MRFISHQHFVYPGFLVTMFSLSDNVSTSLELNKSFLMFHTLGVEVPHLERRVLFIISKVFKRLHVLPSTSGTLLPSQARFYPL